MTPLEFAFADTFTVIGLLAVIAGLAWVLFAWLPRKWRENEQLITAPPGDDCLYCRCLYVDADCTCERRCTAMVCLAPAAAVRATFSRECAADECWRCEDPDCACACEHPHRETAAMRKGPQ